MIYRHVDSCDLFMHVSFVQVTYQYTTHNLLFAPSFLSLSRLCFKVQCRACPLNAGALSCAEPEQSSWLFLVIGPK